MVKRGRWESTGRTGERRRESGRVPTAADDGFRDLLQRKMEEKMEHWFCMWCCFPKVPNDE